VQGINVTAEGWLPESARLLDPAERISEILFGLTWRQ
jgi:hypothetical protein